MNQLLGGPAAKEKQNKRVDKIYEALALQQKTKLNKDGKKYAAYSLPGSDYEVWIRPYTSDGKTFEQIFIRNEYECVVEIYRQFFPDPAETIIDCGANIGLASIWFFLRYPGTSFTVVEPFRESADLAEMNFNQCGLNKYTMLHGGVWNRDTTLMLNRVFRDGKEWSISLEESKGENRNINGYSLSKIVANIQGNIDILKIDIEGAEKVIFEDETATDFLHKVKCIAIEIHDELFIREKIYSVLKENNFFYYNTGELTIAINRSFNR